MNNYEVVYIYDPALSEDQINERLSRYHRVLTEQGKGEITAKDHWGRRQLTFPIKKKQSGHYVVVQFRADSEALPEFERLLKLDEELLRHLVVQHAGEPTAPMSPATRAPRPRDEEEEAEEDEEVIV